MTVFLIVVNIAVLLLIAGSLYYLQKKRFLFPKECLQPWPPVSFGDLFYSLFMSLLLQCLPIQPTGIRLSGRLC